MTHDEQAKLLAEWLAGPEGAPPPDELDPEVAEAVIALQPRRARPVSFTADDLLADLSAGPLVAAQAVAPGAATPQIPGAANNLYWKRWVLGAGGSGALLTAALALFALRLPMQSEPPQMAAPAAFEELARDEGTAAKSKPAPKAKRSSDTGVARRNAPAEEQDAAPRAEATAAPSPVASAEPSAPPAMPSADPKPDPSSASGLGGLVGGASTGAGAPAATGTLGREDAFADAPAPAARPSGASATPAASPAVTSPPPPPARELAASRSPAEPAPMTEKVEAEEDAGYVVVNEARGGRVRDRQGFPPFAPAKSANVAEAPTVPPADFAADDAESVDVDSVVAAQSAPAQSAPAQPDERKKEASASDVSSLRQRALPRDGDPAWLSAPSGASEAGLRAAIVPPASTGQPAAVTAARWFLDRGRPEDASAAARAGLALGDANTAARAWLLVLLGDAEAAMGRPGEAASRYRQAEALNASR